MTARHITYRTLCLAALLIVVSVSFLRFIATSTAHAETTCVTFSFTQTEPIVLVLNANSEKRIELTAPDMLTHNLKLQLSDFGLRDAGGKSVATPLVLKVEPLSAPLEGSLQVLIRVVSMPTLKPGLYVGSLVVEDDKASKVCLLRKQVQLVVPDVSPLVDKVTLHVYRLIPFAPLWWCYECVIPLKNAVDAKATALHQETPLGGVQNEQGGTAAVFWDSKKSILAESVPELPLLVRDLKYAGKYDGQLKFDPATDKTGTVSLTLDASDIPLWPILVIGLSVYLALRVQRYINVLRVIWGLQEREAALGKAFTDSQQSFDESARGELYATYTIADDLNNKREGLRKKITDLQNASTLTLDPASAAYTSMLDDFKLLQDAIAAWSTFADELSALKSALGTQSDVGVPPPGSTSKTPTLLETYGKFLIGKKLTLDGFSATRKDVLQAPTSAQLWFALKSRIDKDASWVMSLQEHTDAMTDDQRNRLKTAGENLQVVAAEVWDADSTDKLGALTSEGGDVSLGEQALRTLAVEIGIQTSGPDDTTPMMSALMAHGALSLLSDALTPPPAVTAVPLDDAARERFYAGAIRSWDGFLTVLAFIVAVLTGLNQYYFGKPFGTLKDYVGILVWALGTKVTVDIVSASLGWLFDSSRSRSLPKSV